MQIRPGAQLHLWLMMRACACWHMMEPKCTRVILALAGIVKMTMPTAFSTSLLAWSMLSFPKAYNAAGEVQASMQQLQWGADYLMKTFTTTGSDAAIVYQVRCWLQSAEQSIADACCMADLLLVLWIARH